jgi:hypothetical protein
MPWYCPFGVAQRWRGDSGSPATGGDAGGEEWAAAERERGGAEEGLLETGREASRALPEALCSCAGERRRGIFQEWRRPSRGETKWNRLTSSVFFSEVPIKSVR